jgi:hypothetical protein
MSMKLRARAREVLEPPANYIGTIVDGEPTPVEQLPDPNWLEISEEDGSFFLYYLDAEFNCFADTWHQTLESAKREAEIGFGIRPEEWSAVEPS